MNSSPLSAMPCASPARLADLLGQSGQGCTLWNAQGQLLMAWPSGAGGLIHDQTLQQQLTQQADPRPALCRRIERAMPVAMPLQSQQKIGYQFHAKLIAA